MNHRISGRRGMKNISPLLPEEGWREADGVVTAVGVTYQE
jgi:hypothetical protein